MIYLQIHKYFYSQPSKIVFYWYIHYAHFCSVKREDTFLSEEDNVHGIIICCTMAAPDEVRLFYLG